MIRLRFVTSHDIVSAAIRAAEYGFWASHVEAIMPDGKLLGAHFRGGVLARDPNYDTGTRTNEMIVKVETTPEIEAAFHDFLVSQVGKAYDITAIEGLVARRNWQEPDSWFCSELICAGLVHAGYLPMLAIDPYKVTPRDLLLILSGRFAIPR